MTEVQKGVVGAALTMLLLAAAVVSIRVAYGALDEAYEVTVGFPRSGQGLLVGSDVTLRGVKVGEVGTIELVDRTVDIRLDIQDEAVKVPVDATATIRPKTLFGEKEVALAFDPRSDGPFVEDGGRLADGAGEVGTEVEGLINSTDELLRRIDADEVAILFTELSDAVEGQGAKIRTSFDSGVRLAALLADTIEAQLRALDSTAELTTRFASAADELNSLNENLNRALPPINAARADYERFLDAFTPFADELAAVLAEGRPDLIRIMEDGDNVMRVLLARQPELAETLEGLADYLFAFANGVGTETLPDGTKFAYFANFISMGDVNDLICDLLGASPVPGFDQIISALQGSGSGLDCSGAGPATVPAGPAPTAPPAGPAPLPPAGQDLLDDLGVGLSTADQPVRGTVGDLVNRWVGAGS